jgi:hypothetical protein
MDVYMCLLFSLLYRQMLLGSLLNLYICWCDHYDQMLRLMTEVSEFCNLTIILIFLAVATHGYFTSLNNIWITL